VEALIGEEDGEEGAEQRVQNITFLDTVGRDKCSPLPPHVYVYRLNPKP